MATPRLRVLVVALALAGCGGAEEKDPVEGEGYSYSVPDGWRDVSDEAEDEVEVGGFRPDSLVIGEREDGFATNVNVIRESGLPDGVTAPDYAELSIAGLRDPAAAGLPRELVETIEDLHVTGVSRQRDAELGGEEAVAWDYRSTQNGRDVRVRQVAAVMDGSGYTVTLTVLPAQVEEGIGALDQVVESWSWD